MQAGQLSAASLFDNIADASSLTMKEALEAVRAASFAEDIEAMPMGMHTMPPEGGVLYPEECNSPHCRSSL